MINFLIKNYVKFIKISHKTGQIQHFYLNNPTKEGKYLLTYATLNFLAVETEN